MTAATPSPCRHTTPERVVPVAGRGGGKGGHEPGVLVEPDGLGRDARAHRAEIRLDLVRSLVLDAAEFDHEDYDRDRWPVWRDWAAGAAQVPSSAIALERLNLFGVPAGQPGR